MSQTSRVSRFVLWVRWIPLGVAQRASLWICRHFTKSQIEQIIKELEYILANRNPEVKPKDDFKEKHPHWRQYHPDSTPPITKPQTTSTIPFYFPKLFSGTLRAFYLIHILPLLSGYFQTYP